jgi:predicted metalloprotease with PDZ domain
MIHTQDLAHRANVLGGVAVWGAVAGSAADRAGLKGGDIVLRVNGVASRALGRPLERDAVGEVEIQVLRNNVLVALRMLASVDDCVLSELSQQLFGRRIVGAV